MRCCEWVLGTSVLVGQPASNSFSQGEGIQAAQCQTLLFAWWGVPCLKKFTRRRSIAHGVFKILCHFTGTKCSKVQHVVRFTRGNMSAPSRIVPVLVNHLCFFFPFLVFICRIFQPLTSSVWANWFQRGLLDLLRQLEHFRSTVYTELSNMHKTTQNWVDGRTSLVFDNFLFLWQDLITVVAWQTKLFMWCVPLCLASGVLLEVFCKPRFV